MAKKPLRLLKQEDGSFTLLAAIGAIVFVGMAALALDVGQGLMAKKELQNVADASVLSGGRELGRIYEGLTYDEQQNYILTSSDSLQIMDAVNQMAQKNKAGGASININQSDILIGQWDPMTNNLSVTNVRPDAISVLSRRDQVANTPINTFFGGILGVSSLNVSATTIGALTPISMTPPGELECPVGISKQWYINGGACGDQITFFPTGNAGGCASWHTFKDPPANAAKLKGILENMEAGTYETPHTKAGETQFAFMGGIAVSAYSAMEDLYDAKKDADGNWKVFVPIYDRDDCSNVNGMVTVAGFATAIITVVQSPPNKLIQATVTCDVVETGRGGGPSFGTKGSIPGLVS